MEGVQLEVGGLRNKADSDILARIQGLAEEEGQEHEDGGEDGSVAEVAFCGCDGPRRQEEPGKGQQQSKLGAASEAGRRQAVACEGCGHATRDTAKVEAGAAGDGQADSDMVAEPVPPAAVAEPVPPAAVPDPAAPPTAAQPAAAAAVSEPATAPLAGASPTDADIVMEDGEGDQKKRRKEPETG